MKIGDLDKVNSLAQRLSRTKMARQAFSGNPHVTVQTRYAGKDYDLAAVVDPEDLKPSIVNLLDDHILIIERDLRALGVELKPEAAATDDV